MVPQRIHVQPSIVGKNFNLYRIFSSLLYHFELMESYALAKTTGKLIKMSNYET